MKLPDKIFGIDTKKAYEDFLERSKKTPDKEDEQQPQNQPLEGIDEGDYIFMPKRNLYVAKERSHLGEAWYDAHKALHQEKARMLTLREFADFLALLKTGNSEFRRIYNDITEVRNPWRAEWLDADFKMVNDKLHINYNHRTIDGILKPQNSDPITDYLTSNKTPGISLDDWLSNPTSYGLPKADVKDGSMYYWAPMKNNNSVARFHADSDGSGLGCAGYPRNSDSSRGVRVARAKKI